MTQFAKPYHDINIVDDKSLCTECGACWGVCPKDNVLISENEHGKLRFRVDKISSCGGCHLCIQVCPGMTVDFTQLRNDVFQKEKKKQFIRANDDIGHYQNLYIGMP